jgi:hypothetical protein
MTYQEKVQAYNKGEYKMPVPPVSTSLWDIDDWITYIDLSGVWF